jgi:molybdenum cofactor cytidylyltransferase
MKNIKGILLSAGESRRMGEPKALLKLKGEIVINRLIKEYSSSPISALVLVLGYRANDIRSAIKVNSDKLKIVENLEYKKEMFSSIQKGISLIDNADAVLIGLVDHPFISSKTINTLISNYENGKILIPVFNERKGHPIIIPFFLKEEILKLDPVQHSLRDIIHVHQSIVDLIEIDSDAILFDMDTKDDYERAKRYEESKN